MTRLDADGPVAIVSPLELVAIDLDGTLVDSVADLHEAVTRMQVVLSRDPSSLLDVRAWVGNGIGRLVHRALTRTMDQDAPVELMNKAMPAFLDAYDQVNGTSSQLYPGVIAGLDWLGSLGVPLVCITNKARRFSVPLLDSLGILRRFDHLIAGDDLPARKPDPAPLLEAARRCRASPSSSVLIGDSVSDIRAARAARFACIAVTYGYNHGVAVDELTGTLKADSVIDSLLELPHAFHRLTGFRSPPSPVDAAK